MNKLKGKEYRGPILRVTSPALGSNDLSLDQSGTSIQILLEPNTVTWHVFDKITTLFDKHYFSKEFWYSFTHATIS